MAYKVELVVLKCIRAQEIDGDEIFLKVNGNEIFCWENMGLKFFHSVAIKGRTDMFDFLTCRARTKDGWRDVPDYQADKDFTFRTSGPTLKLELWESDQGETLLRGDDLLGTIDVDLTTSKVGEHTVHFQQESADYELTYRITAQN